MDVPSAGTCAGLAVSVNEAGFGMNVTLTGPAVTVQFPSWKTTLGQSSLLVVGNVDVAV
jgi:hypothetical protein